MHTKKKGGRPTIDKEKIRHKTIGVRVNKREWNTLQAKAHYMGMSPAQLLRDIALKKRLPSPPVPELNRKTYANLMHLGNNINQLTRSINKGECQLTKHYLNLFQELQKEISTTQCLLLGIEEKDCQ